MLMKIFLGCLVVALILAAGNASAAGYGGSVTLTSVAPYNSYGMVELQTAYNAGINQGQCTDNYRARILNSNPQFNALYAAALGAFLSGKKVTLLITSCTSDNIGIVDGVLVGVQN